MAATTLVVASDHAGLALKKELTAILTERKVVFDDLGAHSGESVDYPDFATLVARSVAAKKHVFGLLVCGTGIGMSIVANKVRGVRAALCHTEFEARMARAHNDANVLCLGERVTGPGVAKEILKAFLDEPFAGGRHEKRVQKIRDVEDENRR